MIDRDTLGRAIHEAKRIGGPWGPPCARPRLLTTRAIWEEVEYNDDSEGDYACECAAMAQHLLDLMEIRGRIQG